MLGNCDRLEVMDPAVLRPGRFGRILYVPLPSAEERGLILKALARNKPVAADVDLDALGHREECQNLSGADLDALVRFNFSFILSPFLIGYLINARIKLVHVLMERE